MSKIPPLALMLLAAGCGAESMQPPSAPDSGASADPQAATGGFVIDLVAAREGKSAYTAVLGKVYGGPVPATVIWSATEEGSGCQLLTPRVPFCSPGCGGAAACVENGQCQAYPAALNLGRVQVSGLGAASFNMDPISGSYQPGASVSLPYPPLAEGAPVSVSTGGGGLPALSATARGIAPLALQGSYTLTSGQPLPVLWTAPADPAASQIEVALDISHHGGSKGKITCRVPDSGALEIPASQVSGLLALGVAGYPTIIVTRVASGTAAGAPGVSLRVTASVEQSVEIPGLRSCTRNQDCPANQTCRADLTCG
jgi:hypothetical protein